MSTALIQCVPPLLSELESDTRGLNSELAGAVHADFSRSGDVSGSYSGLMNRWDQRRGEIRAELTGIADRVRMIRDGFVDADSRGRDALGTGTPESCMPETASGDEVTANRPGVVSTGPVAVTSHGKAAIVEAFYSTTDANRANKDEIEVTRLDNGRWMVALPGVTDLSSGPKFNSVDRAHVFETAGPALVGGPNAYAERVKEAMQRAGVPAGADVMILGHSGGAYAAMDLAGDPTFNRVAGGDAGYGVRVTHVVAAGADTDWLDRDVPSPTNVLVINNNQDKVHFGEDILQGREGVLARPGHIERMFDGGTKGFGHHPDNYAGEMLVSGDPNVARWLDQAGAMYGGQGERFAVLATEADLR